MVALAATIALPPPADLPLPAWRTAGLALMMAIWWSSEPVPIGVTALLPLMVLPLAGVADMATAAAPYANPLVFLFMGGFLLAAGVRRWNLHKRLAQAVVRAIGSEPRSLVLAFMATSAFLSMWVSNTAAVVLMLPIAVSLITAVDGMHLETGDARRFALALLLGTAYAASIGGVGTLIGTPPNALLAGYLRQRHGIDLSFAAWSAVAVPFVLLFLPLAWLILTRLVFPMSSASVVALKRTGLALRMADSGPMTRAEQRVGLVFALAASLWIARPMLNRISGLEGLSDPGIALLCASAFFLLPSGNPSERRFLMTWREAQEIPWEVLILFGGGLSLAAAIDASGLAAWIGREFVDLGALHPLVFLLALTAMVVVLTELASNTATVATLLPIAATIAAESGMELVAVSAAIAMGASCAFMLPVATPPNALVFATGHVRVAAMVRAGLLMNAISILLVSAAALALAPLLRIPN
jgi:sodium-dependent dicarboxylate transporter 2/3/5